MKYVSLLGNIIQAGGQWRRMSNGVDKSHETEQHLPRLVWVLGGDQDCVRGQSERRKGNRARICKGTRRARARSNWEDRTEARLCGWLKRTLHPKWDQRHAFVPGLGTKQFTWGTNGMGTVFNWCGSPGGSNPSCKESSSILLGSSAMLEVSVICVWENRILKMTTDHSPPPLHMAQGATYGGRTYRSTKIQKGTQKIAQFWKKMPKKNL